MRWTAALAMTCAVPAMAGAQQTAVPPPAPATDQAADDADADAAADEEASVDEIVVTGSRQPPGSVVGDIPPDQQLNPADIRSFGVGSVSELLDELAPQTRSGRGGAPVVLLNGRRISGFQEIRDIPTEAILRVDILPEEVALKYGYRADSRVVNFVLRRRFRAATVELDDRIATSGGRHSPEAELDLLSIRRDTRANLHLEYQQSTPLLESERNILPAASDDPSATGFDQTPFRTLLPANRSFSANGVYARPLGAVAATLNGRIEVTETEGQFGLPSISLATPTGNITRVLDGGEFNPLSQRTGSVTTRLGTSLNGYLGDWRWSFTGAYDRADTTTLTETGVDASAFQARLDAGDPLADPNGVLPPGAFGVLPANRARSITSSGEGDLLLTGTLFQLPAGSVSTSIRAGASTVDVDSRSLRAGLAQRGQVSRDVANGQINLDLPIASRTSGGLGAIGSLSANLNLAVDQLSDFGTLTTIGYGANWSPIEGVRLIASVTDQQEAPTPQQLGAPTITTPNARVFDYVRGTTATVTTVSGGNPFLVSDDRHIEKLGLTLKPWSERDLVLTANYVSSRIDDPVRSFPAAIAAIEAAFPDRFERDAAGTLTRIDTRPINFARIERSELRWGVNFSKRLQSRLQRELEAFRAGTGPDPRAGLARPGGGRAGAEGARPAGEGGRDGRGFGGGRGGFGGRGGGPGGGGRLQFALYHTWNFTNQVLVADNGPLLDLLDGDAIGGTGGQPRHELEGQAGYTNNGLGARLSANYRNATRVNALSSADDLRFGDLATFNLRLFADLGGRVDWVRAHPWLRGARVTVSVDNLFNTRQQVTDAAGTTPISYQGAYLDPLGRSVRVAFRKLLF